MTTDNLRAARKGMDPAKTAQALFFVNAAIWLLIGLVSVAKMGAGNPEQRIAMLVIAVLISGNVAAMLVAGIGIGRRNRWLYYFGVAVLLCNIVLTFTDQFGWFDFVTLVFDMLLLGFILIFKRKIQATGVKSV